MVDALTNSVSGILAAQRRANDLAAEILESTSRSGRFDENLDASGSEQAGTVPEQPSQEGRPLVQQIVDLKSAETQFRASTKAFETAAEVQNQFLGSLIDDEG